jgi:serine-type D-Ala-D-Ala endopeptidase (penicillin-binding protein 7)
MAFNRWLSGMVVALVMGLSAGVPAEAAAAQPVPAKKSAKATADKSLAKSGARASDRASAKVAKVANVGKAGNANRAGKRQAKTGAKVAGAARFENRVVVKNGKRVLVRQRILVARAAPPRPSFGQLNGLHRVPDALDLKSSVAYVMDQDSGEVLFSKNARAVLPIASLTKLMTAVVVAESGQPMDEVLTVSQADVATEKRSRSRLTVGTELSRLDMLHLALMSSENRAAHVLGRQFPGGVDAFVKAMNRKAAALDMKSTRFVEPTGLSSDNRSSAQDLAILVKAAHRHEVIREMSTSPSHEVDVGARHVHFVSTNRLIGKPDWEIGLQKTGYISEAGRCLVMQARMAGRQLIMVFLDSAGKYSRLGDAERVRRWVEENAGQEPVVMPSGDEAVLPKLTS